MTSQKQVLLHIYLGRAVRPYNFKSIYLLLSISIHLYNTISVTRPATCISRDVLEMQTVLCVCVCFFIQVPPLICIIHFHTVGQHSSPLKGSFHMHYRSGTCLKTLKQLEFQESTPMSRSIISNCTQYKGTMYEGL